VIARRARTGRGVRVGLAMVGCTVAVHANPVFSLSVKGDCPSWTDLSLALGSKGHGLAASDQGSAYTVFAQSEATGASLRLSRDSGERLIERRFSSRDCRALADAMAVVIEAYFVEVGEIEPTPPARIQPSNVADVAPNSGVAATANGTRSASAEVPNPAPPASQATNNSGSIAASSRPSGSPQRELPRAEPPRPSVFGRAFAGLGPTLALPEGNVVPKIELGGGIDLVARLPLSVEVALASSLPTTSFERPNRVWRWANQGVLRLSVPLAGALQYRPWIGAGLNVAMLREPDLSSPLLRTTTSALVGAGLETAWLVGRGWFGRVGLDCVVLTTRDAYQVDPSGEIGVGPWVLCSAIVGLARGGIPVEN
jgi:hypothetical protein